MEDPDAIRRMPLIYREDFVAPDTFRGVARRLLIRTGHGAERADVWNVICSIITTRWGELFHALGRRTSRSERGGRRSFRGSLIGQYPVHEDLCSAYSNMLLGTAPTISQVSKLLWSIDRQLRIVVVDQLLLEVVRTRMAFVKVEDPTMRPAHLPPAFFMGQDSYRIFARGQTVASLKLSFQLATEADPNPRPIIMLTIYFKRQLTRRRAEIAKQEFRIDNNYADFGHSTFPEIIMWFVIQFRIGLFFDGAGGDLNTETREFFARLGISLPSRFFPDS